MSISRRMAEAGLPTRYPDRSSTAVIWGAEEEPPIRTSDGLGRGVSTYMGGVYAPWAQKSRR